MAKLSIEDFRTKYNDKITDNDELLLELMEDATDSFDSSSEEVTRLTEENNNLRAEIERKDEEIRDIQTRYKERFLSTDDSKPEIIEEVGLQEENVIDVKVI